MTLTPIITPLKVAIRHAGYRQNWIAARLHIEQCRLSRLCTGRLAPTSDERRRLARLLKVKSDQLFSERVA